MARNRASSLPRGARLFPAAATRRGLLSRLSLRLVGLSRIVSCLGGGPAWSVICETEVPAANWARGRGRAHVNVTLWRLVSSLPPPRPQQTVRLAWRLDTRCRVHGSPNPQDPCGRAFLAL
ncbi:hypothetical protein GGTG_08501 [Gaeumannomyces tritici R3-111a-1]|uniref:Uncharacterized protein n=1 Tax=Gaeumannomyces tritici (strain R3-111a-1) TaxID=644352 RepID=J3P4R4_GAET3|nr:hypothetical protein GGTG_08501 [Gaeumannomyces tritici R3-111a-1]EJT74661.1 hypothetical protein GGTG_08501 [Gaeumannomyces tritici R3-111a-1]